MKSIIYTLQTKFKNERRDEVYVLSRFLKRRRLELGKTLDEVSDGVCSTSYLSKIENCLVEVSEVYFSMLFEKLDLDYEQVLEKRKVPIFPNIIKAYLLKDLDYLKQKVNAFCKSNSYCDTEIELLVTLYNLLCDNFHEVAISLKKIDQVHNSLIREELELLGLISCLYNYKTNQLKGLADEVSGLTNLMNKEDTIYVAFLDLSLDIYFDTGRVAKFLETFDLLQNSQFGLAHPEVVNRHLLQKYFLLSLEDNFSLVTKLTKVVDRFENDIHTYNYYYAIGLIRENKFYEAYQLLLKEYTTIENLTLMAHCVDQLGEDSKQAEFLEYLSDLVYIKEGPYYDYLEFLRLKFEKYSYSHLYIYLKSCISNYEEHSNIWVFKALRNNFYKLAFELGKYKEAVKFSMIN